MISSQFKNVKSLRDVTADMLEEFKNAMRLETYKRCSYVVGEIDRLQKACEALNADNFITLGKLMFETHDGLRDLYDVSCKELDILVAFAKDYMGAIGSRLMGGGFGGCTISLVETENEQDFITQSSMKFKSQFCYLPEVHKVEIAGGAKRIL